MDERRIELSEYPMLAEEHALAELSTTFDFSETTVDAMSDDERRYHAALLSAVGSCIMRGPNGEVLVPSCEQVREMTKKAEGSADPTAFLQDFANIVKTELGNIPRRATHEAANPLPAMALLLMSQR